MVVETFHATAVWLGGAIALSGNQEQKDNYLPRDSWRVNCKMAILLIARASKPLSVEPKRDM